MPRLTKFSIIEGIKKIDEFSAFCQCLATNEKRKNSKAKRILGSRDWEYGIDKFESACLSQLL